MKYPITTYITCNFWTISEDEINHSAKMVRTRKPQKCMACLKIKLVGSDMLYETCFLDRRRVRCYTCVDCLDKWIDEHD